MFNGIAITITLILAVALVVTLRGRAAALSESLQLRHELHSAQVSLQTLRGHYADRRREQEELLTELAFVPLIAAGLDQQRMLDILENEGFNALKVKLETAGFMLVSSQADWEDLEVSTPMVQGSSQRLVWVGRRHQYNQCEWYVVVKMPEATPALATIRHAFNAVDWEYFENGPMCGLWSAVPVREQAMMPRHVELIAAFTALEAVDGAESKLCYLRQALGYSLKIVRYYLPMAYGGQWIESFPPPVDFDEDSQHMVDALRELEALLAAEA